MSVFAGISYTLKIDKHLRRGDVKRVRDYLAHAVVNDIEDIDPDLGFRALEFISPYYRLTGNQTELGKVFEKIAEPPTVLASTT